MDRYEIIRPLGEGGMGQVDLARDRQLDRQVALKRIRAALADATAAERFLREAKVTARIEHPQVVRVYDSGVGEDGDLFLVYEFIEGRCADEVADDWPAEERAARVREMGLALVGALEAIHETGTIHRDIKPGNILIRADGTPVLCDFGMAHDALAETLTKTGELVGTLLYMDPLCMLGAAIGPGADIYGLAATLFRLVAGVPPRPVGELYEIMNQRDLPPIRLPPHLPSSTASLLEVLRPALEGRVLARYHSLAAFGDALSELAAPPVPAGPSAPVMAREFEAPAPPALVASKPRFPWGPLAGFLALLAGCSWMLSPGLAPPIERLDRDDPRAVPQDVRALEKAEKGLTQALGRLLRSHRLADGSLPRAMRAAGYEAHLDEVLQEHLDPRYPIFWKRFLLQLAAWDRVIRKQERSPEKRDKVLQERILPALRHLAVDTGSLRAELWVSNLPAGRERTALRFGDPGDRSMATRRIAEVRAEINSAIDSIPSLAFPETAATIATRLWLIGPYYATDTGPFLDLAKRAALAAEDPEVAADLWSGGLMVIPPIFHEAEASCTQSVAFYQAMVADLKRRGPSPGSVAQAELVTMAIYQWLNVLQACRHDPQESFRVLDWLIDLAKQAGAVSPAVTEARFRWVFHIEASFTFFGGVGTAEHSQRFQRIRGLLKP